jgi:hypothetical protein
MRRLIRSTITRLFLTESHQWGTFAKAKSFQDPVQAAEHSNALNLANVELYYSFDEQKLSQYDFALSLCHSEPLKPDPFALKKADRRPKPKTGEQATG